MLGRAAIMNFSLALRTSISDKEKSCVNSLDIFHVILYIHPHNYILIMVTYLSEQRAKTKYYINCVSISDDAICSLR